MVDLSSPPAFHCLIKILGGHLNTQCSIIVGYKYACPLLPHIHTTMPIIITALPYVQFPHDMIFLPKPGTQSQYLCVLPAGLLSCVYSSKPMLGCSVSASFSLLSVALRTRARALDKAGAAGPAWS